MGIRHLDGTALDGTTIQVTFGRQEIKCLKATYGDKIETATLTEMGSQKIDYRTRGTYSTVEGKFSFESTTFRAIFAPLLQKDGFGNEKLPIIVGFWHPDLGDDSDLLDKARFVGLDQALENSNKALEVEVTIVYDQVYWTDNRITINQRDTTTGLGPSNF